MYLKHAFLWYLWCLIWNSRKMIKHMKKQGRLRVQYDTFWYDILTCREHFESNEAKWCILTLFETYARRLLGDSIVLPTPFISIENLDVFFFYKKCRPGPAGSIGATPVVESYAYMICIYLTAQLYISLNDEVSR